MRRFTVLLVLVLALGLGLGVGLRLARGAPPLPDAPAVAVQIREVARLETLDIALYKKVAFAPEPTAAESLWGDVAGWVRHTFRSPHGKAIVFVDVHLGLDLRRIDENAVRVSGREVWIVLPEIRATVELRPGETEVIGSNLDSAETAKLLELAKVAFERQVESDDALRDRARASAERQIRALLTTLGFAEVHFVEKLPSAAPSM